MMLSVVMAVCEEGEGLSTSVRALVKYLEQRHGAWELIVVIDGGSEETRAAVRRLKDWHPAVRVAECARNLGQGAALKTGVLMAEGDVIAYLDADLATPPQELDRLIQAVWENGYDLAVGCRWTPGAHILRPQPHIRRILGKGYYLLIRLLFNADFADVNCGLKAYRRETARRLFGLIRCHRWAFNAEHLLLARALGLRIAEVPVRWSHVPSGSVKLARDIPEALWDLLRIKARFLLRRYPALR